MSLLAQIKKDQLQSRKDRDIIKTSLLTTLIGTLDLVSKNVALSDGDVVAEIKKFIKNVDEVIKHGTELTLVHAMRERELLQAYLPKQMTEDELKGAVQRIIADFALDTNGIKAPMGSVMQVLKLNYAGQYDGSLASKIVKEALQ